MTRVYPEGWHSRGYLPHYSVADVYQFVTFRLNDSLPKVRLLELENELLKLPLSARESERRRRIESLLDRGFGSCVLQESNVAAIVERALFHFQDERYRIHAWVIMPNHVHVLLMLFEGISLSAVVHSWKSFSSREINFLLKRTGPFWQRDYFDRYIRDERHYCNTVAYIEAHPVLAD